MILVRLLFRFICVLFLFYLLSTVVSRVLTIERIEIEPVAQHGIYIRLIFDSGGGGGGYPKLLKAKSFIYIQGSPYRRTQSRMEDGFENENKTLSAKILKTKPLKKNYLSAAERDFQTLQF